MWTWFAAGSVSARDSRNSKADHTAAGWEVDDVEEMVVK